MLRCFSSTVKSPSCASSSGDSLGISRFGLVELGTVINRQDDERCSGLIDQNRVHLIDNGKGQRSLTFICHAERHVVAQVIEAELVIGAVHHVTAIGRLLFFWALT